MINTVDTSAPHLFQFKEISKVGSSVVILIYG